jgi:hypothetical protein
VIFFLGGLNLSSAWEEFLLLCGGFSCRFKLAAMPSRDEPHGYYDNNMASEEEEEKSTEDDFDVEEADDDDDDGKSLLASTSHWPQSYK